MQDNIDRAQSGHPLRSHFEPGLYLFSDEDKLRVIDLENKQDRFVPVREVAEKLGVKWGRFVESALIHHGFIELGRFRIEVWNDIE